MPPSAPARRRARRTRRRASAGSATPPRRRIRPPRARRAPRAGRAGRRARRRVSRRARTSSSGSRRSNSRAALGERASAGSETCTRRSPTRAFSCAGVPAATVLPAAEHDDLVRQPVGLLEVLRGQHERRAVLHQALDRAPHVGAARRVQAGRRLVEEHDRAVHDQAGGEVQAPPHPAAVGPDLAVGGVLEPEARQQRGAARDRARAWPAAAAARAASGSRARSGARRAWPAGRRARSTRARRRARRRRRSR